MAQEQRQPTIEEDLETVSRAVNAGTSLMYRLDVAARLAAEVKRLSEEAIRLRNALRLIGPYETITIEYARRIANEALEQK